MASKEEEAKANSERVAPETLPAYEEEVGQRSQAPADPPSQPAATTGKAAGPTQDSPFNFPSDAPPAYSAASSSSSSSQKPIAIPQTRPDPAAPFIDAYSPALLHHGITPETWRSFLVTLSAFLTAKVSDRAISHAGDVAKQIGERPKSFFKGVTSHVKHVGKHVGNNAKKGNILGAAMGVVGGAISIPITAATGAVSTIVQLPGSTVMAVAKKPQTPRERAVAYAAVANRDWFQPRGLLARLLDTEELCQALGVPSSILLESSKGRETDAKERLGRLNGRIASLEIMELDTLELGSKTLWLVLTQAGGETL